MEDVRKRRTYGPFNTAEEMAASIETSRVFGRMALEPGADVAISVMPPIPTEWWFRPLSSAARVGAHNAVVWNRL